MASSECLKKVQELDDLELALLTCLTAGQHCIIESDESILDDTAEQLQHVGKHYFQLPTVAVDCREQTVDGFSEAILVSGGGIGSSHDNNHLDSRRVANLVIAKYLNLSQQHVQVQALELLRSKRIFTRSAVHTAPRRFLFIALIASRDGNAAPPPRLFTHLNDLLAISHFYEPEQWSLAQEEQSFDNDRASESSVVVRSSFSPNPKESRQSYAKDISFTAHDLDFLQLRERETRMGIEVRVYIQDLVLFLRTHRLVAGGVSAFATKMIRELCTALAALQGLDFVPPAVVQLIVRKVYNHRINITTAESEKSVQWGSDVEAVERLLVGATPEMVVEEVLGLVEVPL